MPGNEHRLENRVRLRASATGSWRKVAPFAALSLAAFASGVGLLVLMLFQAERLVALGLVGNLYYVVLLPLGLAASVFLFGVLRSYASYTGKVANGTLELGGPVVAFALVVIGGFYLPKPAPGDFSFTVLVHGEEGPHDLVLRNAGAVWMTLGADPHEEKIGDKGQADFKNIPAIFRGQQVPLSVQADGFEQVDPKLKAQLSGASMSVAVRRKAVRILGRVQDTEGRPVTNALVRAGEAKTAVNDTGQFILNFPAKESQESDIEAEVSAPGFETWHGRFTPNAGEATIMIGRRATQ